jgi:hypothetical protein
MSAEEVCEHLHINFNHLYQLQYRKQLQWVEKRGKKVYYLRSAVEEFGNARKK